jgi:hypothetical protein
MVLAWSLGLALGAVSAGEYAKWMVGVVTGGSFMAAMGVRSSLSMPAATRAMASVVLRWLVMQVVVAFAALSIILLGIFICLTLWATAIRYALITPNTPPWFPMGWELAWTITSNIVLVLITIAVIADTRLRFDRLAGRIPGGAVASRVDAYLYGHALQPVFLPASKATPRARAKSEIPSAPELA